MPEAKHTHPFPSQQNAPKTNRSKITRTYSEPGDIIYFEHDRAHAWLEPVGNGHYNVSWLTTPLHGAREIPEDTVDWMIETGEVTILAEGYNDPRHYFASANEQYTDTRCVSPSGAPSTTALELRTERGTGQMKRINSFLKHPDVDYQHETASPKTKVALTAMYNGNEVAMAVLGRPSSKKYGDGSIIELERFAAHPDRPENTGSWLLSRVVNWCYLEGYDQLRSYAGLMNDNEGVMYNAAGFEKIDECVTDGDRWENREGRNGHGVYRKRTWVKEFEKDSGLTHRRRCARSAVSLTGFSEAATIPEDGVSVNELTLTREEKGTQVSDDALETDGEVMSFLERNKSVPTDSSDVSAVFGARYQGRLVGVLVVSDPSGKGTSNFGSVQVSEIAVENARYPMQVGTWLVGNVCQWADLHGYSAVTGLEMGGELSSVFAATGFDAVAGDGFEDGCEAVWRKSM